MTVADAAQAVGWIGAGLLLLGYWLVSTRRVDGEGAPFQVVNIAGSIFLGIAAAGGRVWSSVALNGVWAAIGLAVVLRGAVLRRRRRDRPPLGPSAV
jgi:hypothetical protein